MKRFISVKTLVGTFKKEEKALVGKWGVGAFSKSCENIDVKIAKH